MRNRIRVLQGATALLYMGPLLAGLAGYGPAMLVPFVSLFMFWQVLMHPHRWPEEAREWRGAAAWLQALTLLLTQLLFVSLLFGVGRGIGGVMGFVPLFLPLLPVAVSFLAIPLQRMAWDAGLVQTHEESHEERHWNSRHPAPRPLPATLPAVEAAAELLAISDAAGDEADEMVEQFDLFLDTGDIWARLAALADLLDAEPAERHLSLRAAVILKATDPFPQTCYATPGALLAGFAAAGTSPQLLALLAVRGMALLRKIPETAAHFPQRGVIEDLAATCGDMAASEALIGLAKALHDREEAVAGSPSGAAPQEAGKGSAGRNPARAFPAGVVAGSRAAAQGA